MILLATEFERTTTNMPFYCLICEEKGNMSLEVVNRGSRCQNCYYKFKVGSSTRTDFNEVKRTFEEKGCTLLTKSYKNRESNLEYICACCNERRTSSFANFKKYGRSIECTGKSKFKYSDVFQYYQEKNCELLEKIYINSETPMKFRCSCGSIHTNSFISFKKGSRCNDCFRRKIGDMFRFDMEQVKEIFEEYGFKLLEEEYINARTPMRYKCICGNTECKMSLENVQGGHRCIKCKIESLSRENSVHWNHNLTIEEREEINNKRQSPEYRQWKRLVHERDDYTCRNCGSKENLRAHHILNFSEHKELRFEIHNGITFCETCHIQFHKLFGQKNNNLEQVRGFIRHFHLFKNSQT